MLSIKSIEKVARATSLGHGLLFLGFALGLQSLSEDREKADKDGEKFALRSAIYLMLAMAMLFLAVIIFLTKSAGIQDPVGLGLCSVSVGLLSMARESGKKITISIPNR